MNKVLRVGLTEQNGIGVLSHPSSLVHRDFAKGSDLKSDPFQRVAFQMQPFNHHKKRLTAVDTVLLFAGDQSRVLKVPF